MRVSVYAQQEKFCCLHQLPGHSDWRLCWRDFRRT